jgi:hypothetical protein
MSKRSFRDTPAPKTEKPSYPTLKDFDQSRRTALLRLGGAIGAALFGAAALAGCGERKIGGSAPDAGRNPPPPSDGGQSVESIGTQGVAPLYDARIDEKPPQEPDARILAGDVPGPDARIEEPDMGNMAGGAPLPPAQIDAGK